MKEPIPNLAWMSIIFGLVLLLLSCKKEGCTDSDAVNFDSEAKKSDNSCIYESLKVFWYNESTASALVSTGAVTLTFYVDGQIVGSTAANVFWNLPPECLDGGSVTVTKELGSVTTQSYSYSVKDQTEWEYWAGNLNWNANTCEAIELTP